MQTIQHYSKLLLLIFICSSYLWGYNFSMELDKYTPLLGEKNTLTLHFIYDNIEEYEIEEPHFQQFHIKPIDDKEFQDDNGTWHAILRYEFTAKEVGTFTLRPLKTHIEMLALQHQTLYNKNKYLQKLDIFTKPITFTVMPIPHGLKVIGNYQLSASINKTNIHAGEPIIFSVRLEGKGNIGSLDFLTINIPHVLVYEKSINPYEKQFTLISDQNFSIPPLRLQYFNQETKELTILSTDTFFITINLPNNHSKIYTSLGNYLYIIIFFLIFLWYVWKVFDDIALTDKKYFYKKLFKQSKNKEELLKIVAPYINKNRQLKRLIYKLEEAEDSEFKKLKKEIFININKFL